MIVIIIFDIIVIHYNACCDYNNVYYDYNNVCYDYNYEFFLLFFDDIWFNRVNPISLKVVILYDIDYYDVDFR